jgi:hypothetical protein
VYRFGNDNIVVPQEELEQFEGLTSNWDKLRELEKQQQEVLQHVSPQFKNQVVEGIEHFLIDSKLFLRTYNGEGPMAPGRLSALKRFHTPRQSRLCRIPFGQSFE